VIASRTQFTLIRAGRLGTAYVPLDVMARWRPKHSYVAIRVCEVVEGVRQVRSTEHHVTIIAVGGPEPISSIVGRVEADPAHWDLLYPGHGPDCAWVAFALGDWRDHARLLARARRGSDARGYTTVPALSLDPDGECVSDEWLALFAKEASGFIENKQAERREERVKARSDHGRLMGERNQQRRLNDPHTPRA